MAHHARNGDPAHLTRAESQLLAACDSNLLLRTVVSLALNTALRKNEIRTLRWQQIDLLERTLTVVRTKTEGGSHRVIPLNSVAYSTLVRWSRRFASAKPEDYIFAACEAAGIEREHPDMQRIDPSKPCGSPKLWPTVKSIE
jgi:integrase